MSDDDAPQAPARLVVFTRFPEDGAVKTRLIPALGPRGAARVHRELTEHTLSVAEALVSAAIVSAGDVTLEVRCAGGEPAQWRAWLGDHLRYVPQGDGDLGQRLTRAFADGFAQGAPRIVVIGSDLPALTAALLREAFTRLRERDLVLGPAADGGYYLLGLRAGAWPRGAPSLFVDVAWGTSAVADQTRRRAARAALNVAEFGTLADVDRPEDLERWARGPHKRR
jgi:hypothetical protein